ncbi:hypothetical protein PP182_06155 [Maribacter sp. PR1]|uniref:Secreted protein n=1 Tax=Maribacter cobaltidurans TaxID=1178778 RepID=A0ABU7IS22_9FLAO|nr:MULTISPECIES: hypothetical protein [Maribacter]MDC6388255.1 hypothetical protein [Maribacter sp. PR1]MEE1975643.1 hypothetical protein [Maribacter cobaltidurans]
MRKHSPIIIVLCFLVFGWSYAQTDIPTQKPLKIEAVNKIDNKGTTNIGNVLNIPSVIKEQPKLDMTRKNPVKMLPDEELVQAGTGLKIDPRIGPGERLNGSGQYFPDQYLGDIKSNGKFIGIVCRDHEFVDGDRVKIFVNDMVVEPNLLLTGAFKGINVDLQSGFNKIDFEALNHGSSAPNTAQVDVYDDTGQLLYSNKWLLSSGSKATLIVTKD